MNEEVKPEETNVEKMTSEKLATLLNQNYIAIIQAQQSIAQAQNNISAINKELEKRTKPE